MLGICLNKTDFRAPFLKEWREVISYYGYETVSDFLWCEYMEFNQSLRDISEKTGFDAGVINSRIKKIGCVIRSKGGLNNVVNKTGRIRIKGLDGNFRIFFAEKFSIEKQLFKNIRCKHCGKMFYSKMASRKKIQEMCIHHKCEKFLGFNKQQKELNGKM